MQRLSLIVLLWLFAIGPAHATGIETAIGLAVSWYASIGAVGQLLVQVGISLALSAASYGLSYLIGGAGAFGDGYGGNATAVVKDGTWRRYTKQFKVTAADLTVLGQTTNRFNLKFVNFGGNVACPVTPPTIGTMDIDDVRIYKLAAGDVCPATPGRTPCLGPAPDHRGQSGNFPRAAVAQ